LNVFDVINVIDVFDVINIVDIAHVFDVTHPSPSQFLTTPYKEGRREDKGEGDYFLLSFYISI